MRPEPLSGADDALKLKSRGGVVRIIRAAGYSLAGLRAALTFEAAFRQLLFLALVLIPLAFWLPVSGVERALMVGVVLLALIVELIKIYTVIEYDYESTGYTPLDWDTLFSITAVSNNFLYFLLTQIL